MSFLAIRPCLENASSASGDGTVMVFQLSKKYRKNSDSNPTRRLRNQQAEYRALSMNVIIIPVILQLSGAGISTISVDGWTWIMHTAPWIRTIWSQLCGFLNKSGRSDTCMSESVFRGIPGNSQHQFQILKSRWMIVIRMCRIQQLR